jgi:transposase InsO family protein
MVATVTSTPHPGKPRTNTTVKTEISEWAKLQRADKYCKTLIEKIGTETSQRAEDEVETEHKVKEKPEHRDVKEASQRADNQYILSDHRTRTRKSVEDENYDERNLRNEADTIRGDHTKNKRYRCNENGEIIDINNRLIVPLVKVKEVLEENHDHMLAGHLGIAKTLAKIKRQYKWPQMKQHVVLHVNSCLICARRKSFGGTKAPLQPVPPVVAVWERIEMDVVGSIKESNKGYRYILVISDYASRFVFTIPIKNQIASTIARCLVDKLITKYGAPQAVLTDRGTNFLSVLVNEICVLFKIKQMRTTSYHPQTDGLVERFNRTLCDMLACYLNKEPKEWDKYLPFVTFAYNTAIQSILKEGPFYLFFGRASLLPNNITINPRYNTRYDDHNVLKRNGKTLRNLHENIYSRHKQNKKKITTKEQGPVNIPLEKKCYCEHHHQQENS